MKSRISFFNAAVLKKDITRFAPAWGLYLTGMLLSMLTLFPSSEYHLSRDLGLTIGPLSAVNFCYALVCGALLFGDLFNSRLCNALHAMPMRRESWFVTHLVSGLLMSAVPNLVVALCMMPRLGAFWFAGLIWVGGLTLSYLFCFGAAALSAMCTGSRFAMTLVYGLINFLSILVMWTVQFLFESALFGIQINTLPFVFLSPVAWLCTRELAFVDFSVGYSINGWPYLAGIGIIGILLLAVALILYRKRHLEGAGDFITVRFLSPVFLVLYSLAAGMLLFIFFNLFGTEENYFFLAVGIAVGFITGRMLISRTVKVFRAGTFIGLAVMLAVIFGSLGLLKMDAFGIVRWQPKEENVASVSVRHAYDEYSYTADDPEEIRQLLDIHSQIIDTRDHSIPRWGTNIVLTYNLTDGRTVTRYYPTDYTIEAGQALARLFSKPEYVLHTDDPEALKEKLNYIALDAYTGSYRIVTGKAAQELLDAIIADCEAGLMNQDWNYHNLYDPTKDDSWGYVTLAFPGKQDLYINIWNSAKNTIAWLEAYAATIPER